MNWRDCPLCEGEVGFDCDACDGDGGWDIYDEERYDDSDAEPWWFDGSGPWEFEEPIPPTPAELGARALTLRRALRRRWSGSKAKRNRGARAAAPPRKARHRPRGGPRPPKPPPPSLEPQKGGQP
jgi:hypothetical protein